MNITLLAHTQLSNEYLEILKNELGVNETIDLLDSATPGDIVALTAIRTCYSHRVPTEIIVAEGSKYFGTKGSEAKRLFNHIVHSGHTSTLEHINFTFSIEGVSRALLAQLTRHRVGWSYSVQSQRYVKLSSNSRSGGFDYVAPDGLNDFQGMVFKRIMEQAQQSYDYLIELGVPQEDARAVLPNAATTNLIVTCNLRALIDFVGKRDRKKGAQGEIAQLADAMVDKVIQVEPRLAQFLGCVDE
ncbi:FAD-dependent thymidylate synthase [Streptococcus mutans]|nr:FAD-dependent thymidylate synthase [Streptococcus mutans]MCB5030027.1 FAD-dependent thymidylate synthase [Streptococcus mutans]